VFIDKDMDFSRLYFYSICLNSLSDLIKKITIAPVIADYITKEPLGELENIFLGAGFEKYAVLLRMINNSLRRFHKVEPLHFAEEKEWPAVLEKLNEGLDKYTGHFPQKEELAGLIRDKRILVTRKNNEITGLLMYQIAGKKCNFNQWYSARGNDPMEGANLLINLYALLDEKGIRSGFMWVNENNIPVMKIHQRFGFKPDGLADYIYLKK
jgi:L-amino acid N-acyltransferase YncA